MKTDLMEKTTINPMTGYYGEEKHNLREPVVSEKFGIEALREKEVNY